MRNFDGYAYDRIQEQWIKKLIKDNEESWQEYSDAELVRWIYIELGKEFSFSRRYRYAVTEKEKDEIIEKTRRNVGKYYSTVNSDSAICIEIEETMKKILNDIFLLDANVLLDGSGPHVYLEVKTSDYGRIRMDLQEDLANIKVGRKTEKFATQSRYDERYFRIIHSEDLREIDSKIGYIGEDKRYINEIKLEEYKELVFRKKTIKEKIEKAFEIIREIYIDKIKGNNSNGKNRDMKYCERTELYKKALNELYPDNNIIHHTFRNGSKLLSCFSVIIEDGTPIHYLFDKEKNIYTQISNDLYILLYAKNEEIITKEYKNKGRTRNEE